MIKLLLNIVGRRKAVVMNYHRVSNQVSAYNYEHLRAEQFELHLQWLKKYFNVVSLDTLFKYLNAGDLPAKTVCITVDDGYIDSYEVIYPLLKKYNLTATFFISTEGLETGILWDEEIKQNILNLDTLLTYILFDAKRYEVACFKDKLKTIESITNVVKYKPISERNNLLSSLRAECNPGKYVNSFVTAEQLKIMNDNGMTIGAHSHSHPILQSETLQFSAFDIQKSKSILEEILGKKVDYFAYPNGHFGQDFAAEHVALVSELGFKGAVTTDKGIVKLNSNRSSISRFTPWDTSKLRFCARLIKNFWEG